MLHAKTPPERLPGATALYRDFVRGTDTPIHRWVGPFHAGSPAWRDALSRRGRADAGLVRELVRFNADLGVDDRVLSQLEGLSSGTVRAVVTGQQPGVLGGPLLTLYKIATAGALAREIESRWGQSCVPVFWLGGDDDDFAEVRDFSILGRDLSRIDVSIAASAHRPGLRVGDIAADAVRAACDAVSPVLPPGNGAERLRDIARTCRDFGHAAALSLVWATRGSVAFVDGRDPALRRAGRDLLLEFFDREAQWREAVAALGRDLEAAGYHAQLSWGPDSGLFVLRDGVRSRIPLHRRAAARDEFVADIARASPGVVARSLLQDVLLAPVAVVLGPAEIAYRAQLSSVYRALDVPVPVVVPRLSATYLPAPVSEMLLALGLAAGGLVADPAATAREARAAAQDVAFRAAAHEFEEAFARQARSFEALSGKRLDARARGRLRRRLDEIAGRLHQVLADALERDALGAESRWPFLARLGELFGRDAQVQERFLSLHAPLLLDGDAAWPAQEAIAAEFVREALDRRVWHGVYSIP